jgi:LytS/YehU family sensor histidine kinase
MDKIKEVQQILNNHALPTNNGGFIRDSLDGSKFNKIAQDIVKLFAIPAVSISLRDKLEEIVAKYWYNNEYQYIDKQDHTKATESREKFRKWFDDNIEMFLKQ